jgi:predicted PurR-regulated permease PerM
MLKLDRYTRIASYFIIGLFLLIVMLNHLLPALLVGLLVYELVAQAAQAPFICRLPPKRAKPVALVIFSAFIILLLVLLGFSLASVFHGESASMPSIMRKSGEIAEALHHELANWLPAWMLESLPQDVTAWKTAFYEWSDKHIAQLQQIGARTSHTLAQMLIAMVIGAMLSLHHNNQDKAPLLDALQSRCARLAHSFKQIVFAQVRISALNTFFTLIYLAIVLPSCGVSLPLTKTLIVITFLAGLLPVIGNLISNTAIVAVSMSVSASVAAGSLAFLVIIHKFEYFLNARIVGGRIHAFAWELLLAMLLMEAIFGLPGLVAAPIFYAYLKNELKEAQLI